jgi:UDP-N-acetylmuramate dehydrogenase
MIVETGVALAPLTTLGVGGPAARFTKATTLAALCEALDEDEDFLVLGGGSNLVVRDAGWPGLVVQMAIFEIEVRGDLVTAAAGVPWDDLVAKMVRDGRAGIECMSGIPGLVGATPMQNVGAYGQEVSDTIERVDALDRERGTIVSFTPAQCGFAYRSSNFKGSARHVITQVTFRLPRAPHGTIRYAELQKALGGDTAPLQQIRDTVISLRRGKGMVVDAADPESRSAGSFFTNPIVDASLVPAGAPNWPQPDGRVKLSAGWLIERAGFTKGYTVGRAGISKKHALALVNRGGATATELLALADEIVAGVKSALGIQLTPEPVIV